MFVMVTMVLLFSCLIMVTVVLDSPILAGTTRTTIVACNSASVNAPWYSTWPEAATVVHLHLFIVHCQNRDLNLYLCVYDVT
jgi:hypothetical protein